MVTTEQPCARTLASTFRGAPSGAAQQPQGTERVKGLATALRARPGNAAPGTRGGRHATACHGGTCWAVHARSAPHLCCGVHTLGTRADTSPRRHPTSAGGLAVIQDPDPVTWLAPNKERRPDHPVLEAHWAEWRCPPTRTCCPIPPTARPCWRPS